MKTTLSAALVLIFYLQGNGQATVPYLLNFESSTFPPAGCTLTPAGGAAWTRDSTVSGYGIGSACIRFDNFNTASGNFDFRLPDINFSQLQLPYIKFDVAYAMNANVANLDAIGIWWSANGISAWQNLQNYSGNSLATSAPTSNLYVPVPSDWRTTVFPLTYVFHQPHVHLAIQDNCQNSNAVYIDNILIFDSATVDISNIDLENQISVFPSPFNSQLTIQNNAINPKSLTITFYNVLGETLMTRVLYNKYNLLDLSEFKDSIYLYKLISENGAVKSGKIVKS